MSFFAFLTALAAAVIGYLNNRRAGSLSKEMDKNTVRTEEIHGIVNSQRAAMILDIDRLHAEVCDLKSLLATSLQVNKQLNDTKETAP